MSSIDALTLADIAALEGDRVTCPMCGPGRAAAHKRNKKVLRIWRVEPGFATYCCARCGFKGYSHDRYIKASCRSAGQRMAHHAERELRNREELADQVRRTEIAKSIMDGAAPADGGPVQRYLEGRLIHLPTPDRIRSSRAVLHPHERREYPAMVSRIEDPITGAFMGVHVTFLQPDGSGKADATPAKIMRGLAGGGIVRLAEPADTLGLAEGIESALSFMQLSRIPSWSALSATNLLKIKLPASIREVVIAADHDERGMAEARKAGQRWRAQGRCVRIVWPTSAGQDWNDVLKGGAHG